MRPIGALAQLLVVMGSQMAQAQVPPSAITVTADDAATAAVQVTLGRELEVQLKANPTTGYTWAYHFEHPDQLRLKSRSFQPSVGHALGAGGIQLFTFEATAPGTQEIRFEYRRGSAGTPVRTYDLRVTVLP